MLPGLFEGHLMLFADLFYHSFWDINDCLAKYANFRKIWPFVTSGYPNLAKAKNNLNSFEGSLNELSNAFSVLRYDILEPS